MDMTAVIMWTWLLQKYAKIYGSLYCSVTIMTTILWESTPVQSSSQRNVILCKVITYTSAHAHKIDKNSLYEDL